ncbi:uncharacterized shell protein 6-like [Crassostrea angulata]|uniref:uncharacterized shell protein 6-like n=1 Tax=Magallana angulata TaxID=2784310 RepID=UPI0022B0B3C2|nr:uncharacterized shell protein 6-like [Crassostrea angulata]
MRSILSMVYLCVLVGLSSMITQTLCCKCPTLTREQRFCNSDFSLVGKPVGKFLTNDKNSTVHVIQVRLFNHLPLNVGPHYIELESPISQTGCGIQLEIGHDYVFNAIFLGGIRGKITKCGWNEKWAEVPEVLRRPLLMNSIPCPEVLNPAQIEAFFDYHN